MSKEDNCFDYDGMTRKFIECQNLHPDQPKRKFGKHDVILYDNNDNNR